MTPELETRLAQEAQEERYEPGSEPVHALRRGAELALQWRAIESAPKDELILVGPTKRMGICVAMNHSRDGWVTETCSEWASMYTPTHWMPLPLPPGEPE